MPEMPEWAQVWWWLRFLRSPQVMTPLPHQGIDPEAMTIEQFDAYSAEWIEAGAPKTSVQKIVAAMNGNPLLDEMPL